VKRQLLKQSAVLFVLIFFFSDVGVALAQKKHWFVVKDVNGVCRVIEAKEKKKKKKKKKPPQPPGGPPPNPTI